MTMEPKKPSGGKSRESVAVLYQAITAPVIDGVRKPMKKGGYTDSGADIAFALHEAGMPVITPVRSPDSKSELDWVFPDTETGLTQALAAGATVLWANTILFNGHPLESVPIHVAIVGQKPSMVHEFDDKWAAATRMRSA